MEPNFTKLALTWQIVKCDCSEFYKNLVKVSVPETMSHRVILTGGWKDGRIYFPYRALLFFIITQCPFRYILQLSLKMTYEGVLISP